MQLVINTFGASLRKQGDRFLVQAKDKQFAVSAHKVRSILIATAAHLSTDAIELASVHNIDLVFVDKYGDPYARVWQTRMGSTAAIRRRQVEVADGPEGLALVRDWVRQGADLDFLRPKYPLVLTLHMDSHAITILLMITLGAGERFILFSCNIPLDGTFHHQPLMPSTQAAFA
jgi:hypothetical protein